MCPQGLSSLQFSGIDAMRIVAILAVRNEELYLARCLEHLFQQGIETCIIDNGSVDRTHEIASSFLDRGVIRIDTLPYAGFFDLVGQLLYKERLASEINANWFIHHDADEIREAPLPFKTLREGIEAADAAGCTAVDFEEFVFVPSHADERFEKRDYVEEMRDYYFYKPRNLHRVQAWKKTGADLDLISSGGHQAAFYQRRIYGKKFILKHYIVLSASHAREKYGRERVYRRCEIEFGWHQPRAVFSPERFILPSPSALRHLANGSDSLDRSEPKSEHLLFAEGMVSQ
jgi:glycosyltransferase involved in cell wall biosynthesis